MKAYIIELPKILDPRGNLTFLQNPQQIPFSIKRVFWTYDVPGGEQRGGHAYKEQEEVIVALSGSFDVIITNPDGYSEKFFLNRSYYGLYVPARTWRHMENFSTNALSLHMSSRMYDGDDYIRDFEELKNRHTHE
ncbi:FdtA/QdtA family cupin domain-containing protein [Pontibacter korlensis]|uniref:WxcM-like domain-containing protein n=1 Tax=Pontibacter korlensis TaxID=400092 RepID=A0A0E3UVM2_9BACT|nr:FdtA/QdtA family cupin domain-containing protein [Pontibacter korlensis]AKD01956.1 WxcM-like domain-containing protein [Pontibacter korlensis]